MITHPKLRPIEVFPAEQDGQRLLIVHDPSGLAAGQIVVSGAALLILSLMDGERTLETIGTEFARQTGQPLARSELCAMIEQLDTARFLESERFQQHLQSLVCAYRAGRTRVSSNHGEYGLGEADLAPGFDRMLARCEAAVCGRGSQRLSGLVAPHLDYPRGLPGYADAYGLLAAAAPAERYVVLGTNHFGRGDGPVATTKDFETPLGTTRTDREFLDRLQARLGADLCAHDFDHQREHSVELQVLMLQHLRGARNFEIVPVLCPDPCGAGGTDSCDGAGVSLRAFAQTLGELVRSDSRPTVIIAGADLSHVGRRFGDERELEPGFLRDIERQDRAALTGLTGSGDGELFVATLRDRANSTRVCSAGCLYALRTALPDAQAELLRYHQAVDVESGTCVTCSALAFWE